MAGSIEGFDTDDGAFATVLEEASGGSRFDVVAGMADSLLAGVAPTCGVSLVELEAGSGSLGTTDDIDVNCAGSAKSEVAIVRAVIVLTYD